MATGTTLAQAYIELIPSVRGIQGSVAKALSSGEGEAAAAGKKQGGIFGGGFADSIKRVAGPALAVFGGAAVAGFAKNAVSAFSELEDSSAAASVVFGSSMGKILDQSKTAATDLGLTQQQVISAANTFGTYGKAAGLSGDALANFATEQTALAADMASFKGTSPEQAIQAIGAALRGETEPIRAYGVMLDDASLKNEALAQGLISSTKDALSPQNKTLAAQALILKQTTDAQGDFARTSDSTANVAKTLSAQTADVSAKLGSVLAPAFTAVRMAALDAVGGVSSVLDKVVAFQTGMASGALTPDLVRAIGLDPDNGFGRVVGEGIGSVKAFGNAWEANDGIVTSGGFAGRAETAAFAIRDAWADVSGGVRAFAEAWKANDGQVTEDGFAGFAQRAAAVIRDGFEAALPVITQLGPPLLALFLALSPINLLFTALAPLLPTIATLLGELAVVAGQLAAIVADALTAALTFLAPILSDVITGVSGFVASITGSQAGLDATGTTLRVVAGIIAAVLIPVLIRAGVEAVINGAKQAAAWVAAQAGAVRAGIVYVAQSAIVIGRWVAMGAAAVVSGAQTVAIWALYAAEAIKGAIAMGVQAARVVGGWVLMGAQSLLQAARMAAAWLIAMGPVGWVIAAVVGLVALIIANWDSISAFTAKAWAAITEWVAGAWRNITTAVRVAAEFVRSWVVSKVLELQARWNAIWGLISSTASAVWEAIKSAIYNAMVWLGTRVLEGLATIRNNWNAAWTWVRDTASAIWQGIKNAVSAAIGFVRDTVRNVLEGIKTLWSNGWNFVRDAVRNIWDGIKTVISNAWNGVKSTIQTLIDFVRTKIGSAFENARDGVGRAWDAIKAKVKEPIRAVVGFINEGLIQKFNSIPGVNIPELRLPRGFKTGGYTGDGSRDSVAGAVHGREFVFTAAQTAALGKENLASMAHAAVRGGAATAGAGNMGGFFEGNAANIRRHGAYYMQPNAVTRAWDFPGAARLWDGAAGIRVGMGSGQLQGRVTALERGGGILGYTTGNNIDMSPSWAAKLGAVQRRTIAAHEMGHAMGLPHNSLGSIMQPNLANMASTPTALDIRNLQSLFPGGSGKAGSGAENPLMGLVDWFAGKLKAKFPGGGMFIDAAGGLAKDGIGRAAKWVTDIKDGIKNIAGNVVGAVRNFFGGGASLYDNGGVLRPNGGRPQLVQNKTGGDEFVFTPAQLAARDRAGMGGGVILQIDKHYGDPAELIDGLETAVRRQASMSNLRQAVKL